jgi:hypothetical protein
MMLQATHAQCRVSLDAALEAHTQVLRSGQPGMCSLNHPAVTPEPVIALDALVGDPLPNATTLQMVATVMKVVTLVDVQPFVPALWPPQQVSDSGRVVDGLFEGHRARLVGSREAEHQRDARSVGHEMALAAELAPVGGVGARVRTKWGRGHAGPIDASTAEIKASCASHSASSIQVQLMPHLCNLPLAQPEPGGHAAAKAQFVWQVLPGDAHAQ